MQPNDKSALRRAVREAFPGTEARAQESRALCAQLAEWSPFREARIIAGYLPLGHEADITPLLYAILREGKTLCLPRCEDEGVMTFRRVGAMDELVSGRWRFPEPAEDAEIVPPESIELIIVPLEAIDAAGHRLGKGGGYYDRYLPRTKAVKIAAVLRHQRIEYVPHDPHDVPLPYLADADGIHPIP